MLVYHGTSLSRWERIKTVGLIPRGKSKKSNWTHSIESNLDTIYVSDAYAMNFALASINTEDLEKDHAVLIEIETAGLNQKNLVPDEDALEQVGRIKGDDLNPHWDMKQRTRYYRCMTQEYAKMGNDFTWSMKAMGTAGHIGPISPVHFTRIVIIDIKEQAEAAYHFMDNQVSVMNYRFLASKYRVMTKMFFGDTIEEEELKMALTLGAPKEIGRNGITVVELKRKAA